MSRKSHDGALCLRLTRLNSLFYSLVLKIFWSILFNCTFHVYFLPTGVNQHRITIAYTAFVPGARALPGLICTGLRIILLYLASGVFLSLALHTTQCSLLALLLRICFLGCSVPLALIYTVHKLFVLVLFCLGLDIEFHVMIEWYAYHTIPSQTIKMVGRSKRSVLNRPNPNISHPHPLNLTNPLLPLLLLLRLLRLLRNHLLEFPPPPKLQPGNHIPRLPPRNIPPVNRPLPQP